MPRAVSLLTAAQRADLAREALRVLVEAEAETRPEVLAQRLSRLRSESDQPLPLRAQAAYLVKVIANCSGHGRNFDAPVEVVVAGRPTDEARRVFARNTTGEDGRLLDLYTRAVSRIPNPVPVQQETP